MFENGKFTELNINDILPNRFQPRIRFDEKKLNQLADSIYKHGVIQPIIVREVNDKYEIIAGERRYKASKLANKATIPAIIVNLSDRESEEIALLENIQRQDLTPIEEAVSYKRILGMGYITQEELAKKLGKSQSTIANKIRLLNLDDTVQEALLYGKISERHARSLLKLTNREMQRKMLDRIVNERLTVRRTDEEIDKELSNMPKEPVASTKNNLNESSINQKTNATAETLFDELDSVKIEERKDGFMDIDKIMREAKDINTPEKTNDISKLMNQENNIVSDNEDIQKPVDMMPPSPKPETTISQPIENDDNKFVHYRPTEPEPEESPKATNTSGVSFNSIFNSTPVDLVTDQPVKNESLVSIEESQISPQSSVNTIETSQDDVSNSNIATEDTNNSIASAVSAAFEAAANSTSSVIPDPSAMPNNNSNIEDSGTFDFNNSLENNNVQDLSVQSESITNENIGIQHETPVSTPNNTSVPELLSQPISNINDTNNSPEPAIFNNEVQSYSGSSDVSENNPLPIESLTPEINNIPKEDIIEDNFDDSVQDVKPSMISTPTKAVNTNFSNIIHLIRDCAGQIEALGYNINLDEVDLNDNYQVTFTINK